MKAKLINAEGEVIEEFLLPERSPTPEVITDGRTNTVYKLGQTSNGFEYRAVPYLYVGNLSGRVLVDDEGGIYE